MSVSVPFPARLALLAGGVAAFAAVTAITWFTASFGAVLFTDDPCPFRDCDATTTSRLAGSGLTIGSAAAIVAGSVAGVYGVAGGIFGRRLYAKRFVLHFAAGLVLALLALAWYQVVLSAGDPVSRT